jgi:hypothetical protein
MISSYTLGFGKNALHVTIVSCVGEWSRGMILALGARGHGYDPVSPLFGYFTFLHRTHLGFIFLHIRGDGCRGKYFFAPAGAPPMSCSSRWCRRVPTGTRAPAHRETLEPQQVYVSARYLWELGAEIWLLGEQAESTQDGPLRAERNQRRQVYGARLALPRHPPLF